jgi:hypothetical protein
MEKIYKYRNWCTTCQDWVLYNSRELSQCSRCGNPHQKVTLNNIPDNKIIEQRKRWSINQNNFFNTYLNFGNRNPLFDLFNDDWDTDYEIIEHDAGQRKINKQKQEEYNAQKLKREALQKEYKLFKNLTRNDLCACGSGKKYKKCCYFKYKNLVL